MRLVSYARTSGTGDGEDSFEVQETRAATFAAREGHEIVRRLRDENVCGAVALDERAGLLAALEAVQDGAADGLVLSCIDRFARELHIQEAALQVLWGAGGHVYEYDRGELLADDIEDPYRTFIRQVIGAATQLERGMIVRRLRHGRRRKSAAGGYTGGARLHPRYGYRIADGEYVPEPAEQEIIGRMRELQPSMSYRAVAARLTAEGRAAPTAAGVWYAATIRRILLAKETT